jgi:glycosyltransferase involved in cell wall biosynthesis
MALRIGCVSDVCLGYGSPQIACLVESLAGYYAAEALVVEPNRPELPFQPGRFPKFRIERAGNVFPPYSDAGRVDYILRAAELIDKYEPDVLVVVCTYSLPVLFKLRRRPRFVIYLSLESIPVYGAFDVEMNCHVKGMVDLVIFPEENRAARELERCGFDGIPRAIMYNCPRVRNPRSGWARVRNGRVISFGTIDREKTLADYYTRVEARNLPIDLYGPIGIASPGERQEFLAALRGGVRYCGHVDGAQLATLRKEYAFSIVMWNPSNENQRYAAPNKFFESIADGIPPIAAPHPQCKMLLERYDCGVIMQDWSFGAFRAAVETALRLYGTKRWHEMLDNCERAVTQELNWEHQFEKLKAHLKQVNC